MACPKEGHQVIVNIGGSQRMMFLLGVHQENFLQTNGYACSNKSESLIWAIWDTLICASKFEEFIIGSMTMVVGMWQAHAPFKLINLEYNLGQCVLHIAFILFFK